ESRDDSKKQRNLAESSLAPSQNDGVQSSLSNEGAKKTKTGAVEVSVRPIGGSNEGKEGFSGSTTNKSLTNLSDKHREKENANAGKDIFIEAEATYATESHQPENLKKVTDFVSREGMLDKYEFDKADDANENDSNKENDNSITPTQSVEKQTPRGGKSSRISENKGRGVRRQDGDEGKEKLGESTSSMNKKLVGDANVEKYTTENKGEEKAAVVGIPVVSTTQGNNSKVALPESADHKKDKVTAKKINKIKEREDRAEKLGLRKNPAFDNKKKESSKSLKPVNAGMKGMKKSPKKSSSLTKTKTQNTKKNAGTRPKGNSAKGGMNKQEKRKKKKHRKPIQRVKGKSRFAYEDSPWKYGGPLD
ncbi:unnamed protein product, partial [Strongylus vulgaris]